MGCSACGSSSILRGARSARKLLSENPIRRVKGHSSGGILKSEKRLLREAGISAVAGEMKEASNPISDPDKELTELLAKINSSVVSTDE